MNPSPIAIRFGALTEPIRAQLKRQGFSIKEPEKWQRLADAVTRLYLNGFIPNSVATKARDRIGNAIQKEVERE